MDDDPVSSSEMTSATLSDDALHNSESNYEILKCYADKRDEENTRNAIDSENLSTTGTETSDDKEEEEEEGTFKQLSTDIGRPANRLRLATDAESSVDRKRELEYSTIFLSQVTHLHQEHIKKSRAALR